MSVELLSPITSWRMLAWDYSQLELRLIAYYSECKFLEEAYSKGFDVHDMTTRKMWATRANLDDPVIFKRCRTFCKMVNFGIPYGIGEEKFHQNLDTPIELVRAIMQDYRATMPEVFALMDAIIKLVRKQRYLHNIYGRVLMPDKGYMGMNYLIQGTGSDMIKKVQVRVGQWFRKESIPAAANLTMHDELMFIYRPDYCIPEVLREQKRIMQDFPEFHPIPIIVECKDATEGWSKKKEIKF